MAAGQGEDWAALNRFGRKVLLEIHMLKILTKLGDLGKVLFGVWLLLMGLIPLLNLQSGGMTVVAGIVLIAAGVCFLLGR